MIFKVQPICHRKIQDLCGRPYPRHPKGCPNFTGVVSGCSKQANRPFYPEVYDLSMPVFAVVNKFDLEAHVLRMIQRHPRWTEAQLYNCLYWQESARAALRRSVETELELSLLSFPSSRYEAEYVPEAMGVNITVTMSQVGVKLEWPPRKYAYQVALLGVKGGEKR